MLKEKDLLLDSELISITYDYLPLNDQPLFIFIVAEKFSHGIYTPKILAVKAEVLYGMSPHGKNLILFKKIAPVMTLTYYDGTSLQLPFMDIATIKFMKGYQLLEVRRI